MGKENAFIKTQCIYIIPMIYTHSFVQLYITWYIKTLNKFLLLASL